MVALARRFTHCRTTLGLARKRGLSKECAAHSITAVRARGQLTQDRFRGGAMTAMFTYSGPAEDDARKSTTPAFLETEPGSHTPLEECSRAEIEAGGYGLRPVRPCL